MYSIFVHKKDYKTKTLELTVFVLKYDVENKNHAPLPKYKSFFLDFLLAANKGEHYNYAEKIVKALNQHYTTSFLSANSKDFIESIEQTSTKNFPFSKWMKKYAKHNKIPYKEYDKLVQANYTVQVKEEMYIDNIFENVYYLSNFRDIITIENDDLDLSNLPNIEQALFNVFDVFNNQFKRPRNIKISNNNDYIFITYNANHIPNYPEHNFAIIDTHTWSIKWETAIQDVYNTIHEDSVQDIVWLQDYDEIVEAFDIQTGRKIQYNESIDYFLSPSLNLSTHWDENSPIKIKDKTENILCTIALKENTFYTLAFSNSDKFVAIGYDKSIDIWDIESQVLVQSISFEKGVLHKLIFGHDSNLIYALTNGIVYGISLINSNIVFTHSTAIEDYTISDFDINNYHYILIERPISNTSFLPYTYNIYPLGWQKFNIDNTLLIALKEEAELKRKEKAEWMHFLSILPYNESLALSIEGAKKNTYDVYAWTQITYELSRINEHKLAFEVALIALKIRPNGNLALANACSIAFKLYNYDEAIFYAKKCLKLYPHYDTPQRVLALSLAHKGLYTEAEDVLENILNISSKPAFVYNILSLVYLISKDLDCAKEAAFKGIEINDDAMCNMSLAHTYYLQNKMEIARKYYEISLSNLNKKTEFFREMEMHSRIMSLYNIDKENWLIFIESFRPIPV